VPREVVGRDDLHGIRATRRNVNRLDNCRRQWPFGFCISRTPWALGAQPPFQFPGQASGRVKSQSRNFLNDGLDQFPSAEV
jgi:hypothetical protein